MALIAASTLLAQGQNISLNDALDDDLTWSVLTNGLPWLPWFGQTLVSHDGISAAGAGPSPDQNYHLARISADVTGPAKVTFWWKAVDVDGHMYSYASVDNGIQAEQQGSFEWTNQAVIVPYGTHNVAWEEVYLGPNSLAWLDSVQVTPIVPELPAIVTQPVSQTAAPHTTSVLSVEATGTPPLSYVWFFNGRWLGAPNSATLTISNASSSDAGTYTVSVGNLFGNTISSPAVLTVQGLPLDDCVEATNMHWEGSPGYGAWFGETNVTFDGVDAVESWFRSVYETQPNVMQSMVTGPGRFTWMVKKVPDRTAYPSQPVALQLMIDGNVAKSYDGSSCDWTQNSYDVPFGTHQLQWVHQPGRGIANTVQVWLDQFALTPLSGDPPTILTQPQSTTIAAGGSGGLHIDVSNAAPAGCSWVFNGSVVGTGAALEFNNILPPKGGAYVAMVSNLFGQVTSSVATVTVNLHIGMSLGEALNATNLVWKSFDDRPWFAQRFETHDGIAAVEANTLALPYTQPYSWLDTEIDGEGLLTFWIKANPGRSAGFILYDNGGVSIDLTDTGGEWKQMKVPLEAGRHCLRFQTAQSSAVPGPWIDEVKFTRVKLAAPRITQAPRDQLVREGGRATFQVVASSSVAMTYQWYDVNGNAIASATNATFIVEPAYSSFSGGYYYCVVDNGMGTATAGARLVMNEPLSKVLGRVAESYTTGPDEWILQADSRFGVVLASPKLGDNGYSILTANVVGPGWLTFWWRTSSQANGDVLECAANGLVIGAISGESGWRRQTIWIEPGAGWVQWDYQKDGSTSRGQDRAWLGGMTFLRAVPPKVVVVPHDRIIYEGERVLFKAIASGARPFAYQWNLNGNAMYGETNSTYVVNHATRDLQGQVSVDVSDYSSDGSSGVSYLTVNSAIEGQRVMSGSAARMIFRTRPPAPASYIWQSDGGGRIKDVGGNHGASKPVLTLSKNSIAQDNYSATATTRTGWSFTGRAQLLPVLPGAVVAWGFAADGNTEISTVDFGLPLLSDLDDVVAISIAQRNGAALLGDGTVRFFGDTTLDLPGDFAGIKQIAAGDRFTLGLKNDGTITMASESSAPSNPPPTGLTDVSAICVHLDQCTALRSNGTVVAWNEQSDASVPKDLTNVVAISTGRTHRLALKNDGTVVAWGDDVNGELFPPAAARNVVAIASGDAHCLALRRDGTVVAWGDDSFGQCDVPVGLKNVVAIAAGASHSVALKADGTVVTWGGVENWDQTLGSATVPQGLSHVAAIAAGPGYATYAVVYAPSIVDGPQAVLATPNGVANMSLIVAARGRGPLQYQWRLNGKNIPGSTSAEIVRPAPRSALEAARSRYDVLVSNSFGTTTSASIIPPFVETTSGSLTEVEMPPLNSTNGPPIPPLPDPVGALSGYQWVPLLPIQTPTVAKDLQMMRTAHGMTLMWHDGPGAVLESTDDLSRGFSADNGNATLVGGMRLMQVTTNSTQRFYRLRKD